MSADDVLAENLRNRRWLLSRLRAEIVGPDPQGEILEIPTEGILRLSWENFRKAKRQANGEEIIWQDPPTKRYGAGILFPRETTETLAMQASGEEVSALDSEGPDAESKVDEDLEDKAAQKAPRTKLSADDSDDYDVRLANAYRPSAIGLSFLADVSRIEHGFDVEIVDVSRNGADHIVEQPPATYEKVKVDVGDGDGGARTSERTFWLRRPIQEKGLSPPSVHIEQVEVLSAGAPLRRRLDLPHINLMVVIVSRKWSSDHHRLITVSLVNGNSVDAGGIDDLCLYQAGLRVRNPDGNPWITPYPEPPQSARERSDPESDESINKLLYREYQTFAIGHGCAADWNGRAPAEVDAVWTDVMPIYETPSTSADLFVEDSQGRSVPLKVSMRKLAGLDRDDDGRGELELLIRSYEKWIDSLLKVRPGVPAVPESSEKTAVQLIKRCRECLDRMKGGIRLLEERSALGDKAREAFRLANHAMLLSQLRATRDVRMPKVTSNDTPLEWSPAFSEVDPALPDPKRGHWRAFQIAFLLMSLRGICDPQGDEREIVDLIWFPTGGGKTEAYLGLTAFTIFFNRLADRKSGGADVLMRYTLRLLTAQQFQRAALLFCAMEVLRRTRVSMLGEEAFRIGLWVGGSTTPNLRSDAVADLKELERDAESENPFVLLKCPWCAAKFGPTGHRESGRRRGRQPAQLPSVLGYKKVAVEGGSSTVVYKCFDTKCDFGEQAFGRRSDPLPVVVIDEDILSRPPNLVIGTVDKFALLAWKPEVRALFGIGDNGKHTGLPPSLIIQDELHLISGPLGSMVGAYETVIEKLCTDSVKPKIIASTATICRANEQVRALYARDGAFLFPPAGLEAGDSFFAKDARDAEGNQLPGRLYVGVLAQAHGSFQTTLARCFASLLQHASVMEVRDNTERDPWWTLLCFFNSLRELGGAATLFVSDTRDYTRVILDRLGIKYSQIRKLFNVSELTSRIRSDQVPKELDRLERGLKTPDDDTVVDACLASNIIEVGVDISRLALMAVAGQPKTTSQYIQVTSRVGRDPQKPGLVAILYGQSRPRDRSHYERFRTYHQKLYAQVEPTSVTPFSPPAVERALHAVIVSAIRQQLPLDAAESPEPFPFDDHRIGPLVESMIDERVLSVAPEEATEVKRVYERRLNEWRSWQPAEYGSFGKVPADPPLLHLAGITVPPNWNGRSWATMSSLREVDASCEAYVTDHFNQVREASE